MRAIIAGIRDDGVGQFPGEAILCLDNFIDQAIEAAFGQL